MIGVYNIPDKSGKCWSDCPENNRSFYHLEKITPVKDPSK